MRLLKEVPGSVLWLLADRGSTQDNLRREARAREVEAERLVFAARMPYAQHLGRLSLADLFLDTLPYNAGTTASDALRAGVPILTCVGDAFASRMAGSLLNAVGLRDLITHNLQEYERKALMLAREPQGLHAVRVKLAENLPRAALFNTARFCRHLEAAYVQMHERALRGEKPAAFSVTPIS
jgi:predicted O-linked N-acetylglucosamine transferase (SPINDLY family)